MKKSARTRTIKTSCELSAGAGEFSIFPPVTRGNRRQSVPAEIFACIRWYFYLRNSLPAAIAGKFARTCFTVNSLEKIAYILSFVSVSTLLDEFIRNQECQPTNSTYCAISFLFRAWLVDELVLSSCH